MSEHCSRALSRLRSMFKRYHDVQTYVHSYEAVLGYIVLGHVRAQAGCVPMAADVGLANKPGTVYVATLTGPTHQAQHSEDLSTCLDVNGLGRLSVSIQMRCALFAAARARTMSVTPCPAPFFFHLAEAFAKALGSCTLRDPSFLECKFFFDQETHTDVAEESDEAPLMKRSKVKE